MPLLTADELRKALSLSLGIDWEERLRLSFPSLHSKWLGVQVNQDSLDFVRSDKDLRYIGFNLWREQISYFEVILSKSIEEFVLRARDSGIEIREIAD